MSRRRNGEGSVRLRADGRWEGRYAWVDAHGGAPADVWGDLDK